MRRILGAVIGATILCSGAGAWAHHSGAMFDAGTQETIEGTIVAFQWANPHAWIQLRAPNPQTGEQVDWMFESLGVNQLTRRGWKRDSLKPGDAAVVVFNPVRNGEPAGRLVRISVDGQLVGNPE